MTEENSVVDKKLWNGTKNSAYLGFTIGGKRKRLHIGKDVIRVLGGPSFVCIRVNESYNSFVVMPCDSKMYLSFKVPSDLLVVGRRQMEVTSTSFVAALLSRNGLELDGTYNVEGTYLEKNNAVKFQMADVRPLWGEEL